MSQFFFHLVSPAGYDVDDVGSEFPTLELAYLDAHAAASEMCVEIIRDHGDPMRYQFEIEGALFDRAAFFRSHSTKIFQSRLWRY